MRELIFSDVYKMSKILSKMELKMETLTTEVGEDGVTKRIAKTSEQVGGELILQIGENLHLVEKEVNEFLGSLIGIPAKEFAELPLTKTLEYVEEFKKLGGIKDFFKSASRLMK